MLALGKLLELLAMSGQTLSAVCERIPKYYRASREVECPWEQKGTVMRRLHEAAEGLPVEQLDGIKVQFPEGWVLALPDISDSLFHVRAESRDHHTADTLAEKFAVEIQRLQADL